MHLKFNDTRSAVISGTMGSAALCFDGQDARTIDPGKMPSFNLRPCNLSLWSREELVEVHLDVDNRYTASQIVQLPASPLATGLAAGLPVAALILLAGASVPLVMRLLRSRRARTALTALRLEPETEAALLPLLLDDGLELSTNGLGAGGFGRVVRGTWRGTSVAVKLLHASLASDPDALAAVAQEAAIQASLRHPHIVQLYGVAMPRGSLALVLELCDGGLQKTVYGKSLAEVPLKNRLLWLHEAASALAFMHSRGLAHRDVKAANVLLAGDQAKVTDLGLSRDAKTGAQATGMTLALGTPAWCAPEVIERDRYDEKAADVYAFGVTIWETLSGAEPFADVPVLAITVHIVRGARPPIDDNWPAAVRDLISRCWATRPETRPGMEEVSNTLGEIASVAGQVPSPRAKYLSNGP